MKLQKAKETHYEKIRLMKVEEREKAKEDGDKKEKHSGSKTGK